MPVPCNETYLVQADDAGMRLDVFVTAKAVKPSRTFILKLINEGLVTVNGQRMKANYRLKEGEHVAVTFPPPVKLDVLPEPIPLNICYEDEDMVVINKPRGMVVHPAHGHYTGTLVNALLHHCADLSGIGGILRPGIVHRLDKDTSGLLMVAKNDLAHQGLARQLKNSSVTRGYLALAHGQVQNNQGVIEAAIGRDPRDRQKMSVTHRNGKHAVTRYRVLGRSQNYTLLELRLETGRTHQIRVHLSYIGHPVVGDSRYGPTRPHFDLDGQFLHAYLLIFIHPRTGSTVEIKALLPDNLTAILETLDLDSLIP